MTLHDYGTVCPKKNFMHGGMPCPGPAAVRCWSCSGDHYGRIKGAVTNLTNRASALLEHRLVDRFIAVSMEVASRCNLDRGRVPYDVIPTFISDDIRGLSRGHRDRLQVLPGDGYLLFVGDLTRLKGIHILLRAYEELDDAPPLVLIGRRCRDTPGELPSNVHLFASWPHPAVLHAWSRCLFGVVPSIGLETCGTVVMEANAFSKPVIAARTGGLSETVVHGETGLLVSPGDAIALRDALSRLIRDGQLRLAMSAAALAHAETYMAKAVVPKIESIYAEVCSRRGRGASSIEERVPA